MKQEWQVFRKRYIPAILPIAYYWSWEIEQKLKIKRGLTIAAWDKGWHFGVWDKEGYSAFATYSLSYLLNNVGSLDRIRKEGFEAGQIVVDHCKRFSENIVDAKYEDFVPFFEKLKVLYNTFNEKSMAYWIFIGELIEEKLSSLLATYSENEKQEILHTMSSPPESSYSQIEESDFEEVVKIAKKNGFDSEEATAEIERFSKKYFWFPYEYVGPNVWDVESVTKRVKENLRCFEAKGEINVLEKQQKCKNKFNLSKELVDLFKVLHAVTLMQDDRKMLNAQACYYINGVVAENLADRFQTNREDFHYFDVSLMKKFLKDEDKESLCRELKKRLDFVIILQADERNDFYSGKEAREKLKQLGVNFGSGDEKGRLIRGRGANQGVAKGRVRIMLTSSDKVDFKKGDILVTPMTTPDFVPLMGKAAAIVTDEGGITCHAAIISRELGIPCIVGTNDATKLLKEGDLVEVDATNGIVRKVE